MKKTLLLITIFIHTITSWCDTLFYYNGTKQNTDIIEISPTGVTSKEEVIKSSLRAISFSKIPSINKSPQDNIYINETFQSMKKDSKTIIKSFFTRKEKTYTIKDKNRWSEEIVFTCYVNSELPLDIRTFYFDFNCQSEEMAVLSASYTDKEGVIKPFQESTCTTFSRYPNNHLLTSLKRFEFVIPKLPKGTIVNFRILKSRVKAIAFDDFNTMPSFQARLPISRSKITVKVPIQTPKIMLNHQVYNDNDGLIKYEMTKTSTQTSRIWSTTDVKKTINPISLKLSIGDQSKTKRIKAYSQHLALLILEVKEKNYMPEFKKRKGKQSIIADFLSEYNIISSSTRSFPTKVKFTYTRKSGEAIDLVPLLIAELEFHGFKPELFFMNKGLMPDTSLNNEIEPLLRIDEEIFFINPNTKGNFAWSGSCYFGSHLSSVLSLEESKLEEKKDVLNITVHLVATSITAPGSISFHLNQEFNPILLEQFPNATLVKVDTKEWRIDFKSEGSRISHNHLALQIPNLAVLIAQDQNIESIHTTVLLPEQWEIYHLPKDIKGELFYFPSEEGFTFEQTSNKGRFSDKKPILLQLINSDKKWFQ